MLLPERDQRRAVGFDRGRLTTEIKRCAESRKTCHVDPRVGRLYPSLDSPRLVTSGVPDVSRQLGVLQRADVVGG